MPDDCLAATGLEPGWAWLMLAASLVIIGATLAVLGRKRGPRMVLSLVVGLVVALGAVTFVAGSPSAVAAPDCPVAVTTAGVWAGDASVAGFDYSLEAAITDDGTVASATASYTAGGTPLCTSTWTQLSRAGTTITFIEAIDAPFDPLACSDGGTITVTPAGTPLGSTLAWTYAYADPALAAFAHGTTLFPVP